MSDSGYITDPEFNDDLEGVREHYEAVRGVIDNMALLGDQYPTLGFGGNAGWYQTRDTGDIEQIEAGYTKRARCTTFDSDISHIIDSQLGADGRERELFNISSWKHPDAATTWKHCTEAPDREWSGDGHPPGYEDLRGFGFWFDLDLEHKDGRAALTDDELATVEQVQQRVIDAVADVYNVASADIYGLDSGGGAYVYGPPEATLNIVEYLDDAQEREWFFDDLADRINDGPLEQTVEEIIDEEGADDLLDPDWIQNKNRQTKAPGSLHHSHDIIVTPLRDRHPDTGDLTGRVDYTATRVSEFTKQDIKSLESWADGLTSIKHTDAVGPLLNALYPEHTDDADDWRDIVDAVVERRREAHERQQQRRKERRDTIREWTAEEGSGGVDRPEIDADAAGSLTAPDGMYSGAEIVTDRSQLDAAIASIDVTDVVRNHASDAYDTSTRNHETTFDPSWRHSGSGKSCAIPNGANIFVDNGCNGAGGPVRAYALGEGILSNGSNDKKAASRSITGSQFNEAVQQMRADGYNIPVYVPEASDEHEQTPLWGLRKAALALGIIDDSDEFIERETDDGDTYLGFTAATYNDVLDALDNADIEHGRDHINDDSDPIKEAIAEHNDQFDGPADVPDDFLAGDGTDADGDDPDTDDDADDGAKPEPWGYVRELYRAADEDSDVKKGPARQAAQQQLEDETDWMCVTESDRLWKYNADRGIFEENGEADIGSRLVSKLGPHYSRSEKGEIIDRVKENNRVKRSTINARQMDSKLLCVGNGVVNLKTGHLLPHSPTYRFVRGLDVNLATDDNGLTEDPDAVLSFLDDVTERKADRDTMLDHLAHGFMPGHPYRAFVVTYGPGGNGKTQVARLFRGFVGDENASSVEIDELVNDDFATSDLVGNFINWGDDMSGDGGGQLEELSTLKKASGGSSIRSNEKYEKTFDFVNEAALFFSANEPPRFAEEKASVKDRLYPIQMPYRFVSDPDPDNPKQKQKVPGISQQLLNDDSAMRGLLRLAVEHAQDLIERNGEYSMPEGPEERFESYTVEADPIVRFARMAFEQGSEGDRVSKGDAYHVYRQVMDIWRERTTSEDSFKRYLPRCVSAEVETSRSRALASDTDDRVRVWKRLKWTEDAAEFMPDWLTERYRDQFDDADAVDATGTEDDADTDAETESSPQQLSAGDLEASESIKDREKVQPVRGTIMAMWENRYGKPVTELHDEDGSIDIQIEGFESPELTPLSEGGTYELDGLRYRDPGDERPYYELRPTTGIERLDDTDADSDTDDDADGDSIETDTETTETTESPDGASDAAQDTAAADGGTTRTVDDVSDTDEMTEDIRAKLADAFNESVEDTGLADKMALQRALKDHCGDMQSAKQLIEKAKSQGWISEPVSHRYERGVLPER